MWSIVIGRGNNRFVFHLDASNWEMAFNQLKDIIAMRSVRNG